MKANTPEVKTPIESIGPELKNFLARETADWFESSYPNLLASMDAGLVFSAIASYFRVEGLPDFVRANYDITTLMQATRDAFLELNRRGALKDYIRVPLPLSEATQNELDQMAGVAPVEIDPAAEARAARSAALDEVATDWKCLDSRAFKSKWMLGDPARRAVYESAISAGRI